MSDDVKTDFAREIYKDKISKLIARAILLILLLILVISAILHFNNSRNGKHSKFLWGLFENNIPKGYPDTVYVQLPPYHDTIDRAVYVEKSAPNQAVKKTELSQTSKYGDNQANINNGTNNGIIGNNNTLHAPLQPHPEKYHVSEFKNMVPDKNTTVKFMYSSNSNASQLFLEELVDLLKKEGYSNINTIIDLSNQMQLKAPTGITRITTQDGSIQFFVKVESK